MHWLLVKYSRKKLTLMVREITCCVGLITETGTDYLHPYTHTYIHTHTHTNNTCTHTFHGSIIHSMTA